LVTRTKEERFRLLEQEAATYDKMEEPYLEQAEQFRERTIKLLGCLEGRVLEVGCATGRLTTKLPGEMDLLVCLDVSISKIRLAKKRTAGWPEFVKGDMEHLPFKHSTFDLVVSHYALHHAFNPEKAVSESTTVTRRGGRVFYAVPRASDDPHERRKREDAVKNGERLGAFTPSQFRTMLRKEGSLVRHISEDFSSHIWAGRILFLDCRKD
jgi:ubiquinone/menaquinone biosynthesis C-methylase UbiE